MSWITPSPSFGSSQLPGSEDSYNFCIEGPAEWVGKTVTRAIGLDTCNAPHWDGRSRCGLARAHRGDCLAVSVELMAQMAPLVVIA